MKIILLARHAKSSWKYPELEDYDRSLNKRGKRDAPFMGKILEQKYIMPDLIVSSHALRAKLTAEAYAESLGFPIENIILDEELYMAELSGITRLIFSLENSVETVLLVGHNPGLTTFANFIVGSKIDNIPTCGILGVVFSFNDWKSVSKGSGEVRFYEYPKKYFK